MSFSKLRRNTWLLLGCIVFLILGMGSLFMGALIHINPEIHHFAGLFHHDSLMNLVYSLIPAIK